jgi:RNA polymerase sigma-54 factor
MHLEQRLAVKLSQRLIMTPSLQQAIKLLQMSKIELLEEVAAELVENPALEEGQSAETAGPETTPEEAPPAEKPSTAEVDVAPDKAPYEEIDYESFFQDLEGGYVPRAPVEQREELPSYENVLTRPQTLSDYLHWQLEMMKVSPLTAEIGRAIIGNLDEDGFLQASIAELQQMGDYPEEEVLKALEVVRQLDPVGVAASTLQECLLRQLDHLDLEDTPSWQLVHDHWEKLEARRYKELAEVLGCTMAELGHHLEIIRHLDPRPGQRYNTESSRYVIPDVYVVKLDNEYKVILNEEGLPRLHVSSFYRRMAGGASAEAQRMGTEEKNWAKEKVRSAFRLIKSIEERQRTIYKVAESIVRHQQEFLDHGVDRLRPLILKDVAEDIQMHESTVSRVVNNKYMHTHRGLFEMKYFFHSGISSTSGDDISSRSVKEKIRKIIAEEDAKRPLSDSEIAKMLKQEGLQIARRTVAKYREELRIPSSNSRKQIFT